MKLETVDYLADDAAQQFVTSLRETGVWCVEKPPDSTRACRVNLQKLA